MLVAKGNLSRRPDTTPPPPLDCDGQSCCLYVGKLIQKLKSDFDCFFVVDGSRFGVPYAVAILASVTSE